MPRPSGRRPYILLASVLAAFVAALAIGCAGLGDDGTGSDALPSVALMHVGLDHVPGSFPGLATQLEEEFGWDLPEAELDACVDEKRTRCVLAGEKLELIWRNLDGSEAETQAEVFVGQGIDVIVAFEDTSIDAAQKATTSSQTPIVFLHPSDPVRDGLVKTLDRPDRNLTGVYGARDEVDKQLELYQLLVPNLRRVLTLVDPEDPRTERLLPGYQAAAAALPRPLEPVIREASSEADLRRVFRSLRPDEVDGVFLLSPSLRLNHTEATIELANRAGLPVQAHRKEWVEEGALFSYGIDLPLIGRTSARYVDSILRGTPPADLPVQEVPKIEFALNLETAARLGLKVPREQIIRAHFRYP
jgi:putative tryptophan/tyrosine transport system substrate-binding protein